MALQIVSPVVRSTWSCHQRYLSTLRAAQDVLKGPLSLSQGAVWCFHQTPEVQDLLEDLLDQELDALWLCLPQVSPRDLLFHSVFPSHSTACCPTALLAISLHMFSCRAMLLKLLAYLPFSYYGEYKLKEKQWSCDSWRYPMLVHPHLEVSWNAYLANLLQPPFQFLTGGLDFCHIFEATIKCLPQTFH